MTPEGEDSIKSWVFEIQAWGFPSRVAQLREMGEELLQAKGDYKELGKKLGFRISQSPSYVTSQIQPYSGSRSISSSESRYNMDWLNLYKVEYGILDEDTYNMVHYGRCEEL